MTKRQVRATERESESMSVSIDGVNSEGEGRSQDEIVSNAYEEGLIQEKYPFGGEDDVPPVSEVLGKQEPPTSIAQEGLDDDAEFGFNGEVAKRFEEVVIPKQIPGYNEMRYRLAQVCLELIQPNSTFVDLGTSNGRMIRDLAAGLHNRAGYSLSGVKFIGVDIVDDMLRVAKEMIAEAEQEMQPVNLDCTLTKHDLRNGFVPVLPGTVGGVTSIYTIQFVPIEHRQKIISQIYESLKPGGFFILAEKVLSSSYKIDELLTNIYYQDKSRNGISDEDIRLKRKSLEKSLMPMSHLGNIELLENAGFHKGNIDLVWKNLQFEAILALK